MVDFLLQKIVFLIQLLNNNVTFYVVVPFTIFTFQGHGYMQNVTIIEKRKKYAQERKT